MKSRIALVLAAAVAAVTMGQGRAATVNWNGGTSGDMTDVTNWSSNPSLPGAGDVINFGSYTNGPTENSTLSVLGITVASDGTIA